MKKGIIALVLVTAAILFLREGFRLEHLQYPVPASLFWQAPPLSEAETERVRKIFSEPLIYLDKGSQSYAFIDASGEYVVKFFKFKHLKASLFASDKKKARADRKVEELFKSYRLAYESHKADAGLVYVHLSPDKAVIDEITLIGPWREKHVVKADSVYFVIQKRATPLEKLLTNDIKTGHLDNAEAKIINLFDLFLTMHQKGLYDKDHALFRNAGFAGEKPLHFDVGMLHYDDSLKSAERSEGDLKRHAERLNEWFNHAFPTEAPRFKRTMESFLEGHFHHPVSLGERG